MPREIERRATVLKKLQDSIQHKDSNITPGRRLSVEKWVKTYIEQVEYLKEDELQFLYKVFQDESCWSSVRLNNPVLGQKLTEEKIGEINNPLCRYNMACRYCVTDKIPQLFQKQLESYKSGFSSEEVDDDGKPATNNHKYVRNELLDAMKSVDPVFTFWIDKKSGEFKKHDNAVEGFNKAVEFKWSEGVEYFYRRMSQEEKIDNLIVGAVANLSAVKANHNVATVLDFLIREIITDSAKYKLLPGLSNKGKGVMHRTLSTLVHCSFVDVVQDVVKYWSEEKLSLPKKEKILSSRDYASLLSSLSNLMLKNSDIDIQTKAREVIVNLWECSQFIEHKVAIFDASKDICASDRIKNTLARLIVDYERSNGGQGITEEKKKTISGILKFAKDHCSVNFAEFQKQIVKNLKTVGREGMKEGVNYSGLAEDLFSELEKTPLPTDPCSAGNPQSMLGTPGVSGLSSHSK
ncbi:hypothetical protein [Wolbachia endosymbiont (group A) of Icerya purchasi]|uniref:hypothetical protein n=1 Tax=Wolbachia endosymbiont (group A) of Icerya purchasi TaxID=2954019 RepID=UPI002232A107|nr:hypothetical protein [Wolbachia endosymbiont (group A) of Icerya purchasi]